MPKPITQTSVVNAAAARLGSTQRLDSMADTGSDLAKHAKAHWDMALGAVLADHPWNFAVTRAQLNSAGAPDWGYDNSYTLPADCIAFLPHRPGDDDYCTGEVEGGLFLTDAEAPLNIRYVSGELADDTSRWSYPFAKAVELELAVRLCEPMTGKLGMLDRLEQAAAAALKDAKRHNGRQDNSSQMPDRARNSSWLRAQRTGAPSALRSYFRGP